MTDLFVKEKGPLCLVNFHQPWSSRFSNFDLFFDNFSNLLVLHNEGYFVIWDEFQKYRSKQSIPLTLNLATTYKDLLACAVHPSKTCLALQIAQNELTVLFLKSRQADEVRF